MRLYVDANVLIKAVEGSGETQSFCRRLLQPHDGVVVVTSELSVAEVLVGPFKKRGESIEGPLSSAFMALLRPGGSIDVVPVGRDILIGAARLRATRPALKLPDAIHWSTATASDCTHFVTGDERLLTAAGGVFATVNIDTAGDRTILEPHLR